MKNKNTNVDPVEVLKKKNPFMYKAISMAGIAYFDDESVVEPFIDEATKYIKSCAETTLAGKPITLRFGIPEEAKNFDTKVAALALDVKEQTITSEMAGIRMKSLFDQGINIYKDYTKHYSPGGDPESIEKICGMFDLIMSLEKIAQIADNTL